jgi:phosphoglycolate phosphatase
MADGISSKTTLFFDLDGPLLDVSGRYAALHQAIVCQLGERGMEADRYWQCKRARWTEESILKELGLGGLAASYVSARLALIESAEYLARDRPWPWTENVLGRLKEEYGLVIVTVRSNRLLLAEQLKNLNLVPYFDEILSEAANTEVDRQKAELIREYLSRRGLPAAGQWMIGDTEMDILAGRHVGLLTAGVLCGIRDREHLALSAPHFLLSDIRELPFVLDEKSRSSNFMRRSG